MRASIHGTKELDTEAKQNFLAWVDKIETGSVFIVENKRASSIYRDVGNLFLSQCYNCGKNAIWVHQTLVYPAQKEGARANADLPDEICRDFEEARVVLNYSPRGAAALLRLCVQKLCAYLGEKGRNIDEDIASLVKKGLHPLVQKSLDVVRVIGNEAVHPGVIDLKDDRDTALQLLELVNGIADQMITHPKTVERLYGKLPESKRLAIEERNEKAGKTLG
ncbi:DUF4145 domain-containing protein [Nitrosospira sp. NRS527]|uniref:DUF4145 domain-containing protein n=1 Tax=Nitrosospira sp. NRS527 TaxID=155925 RepID=UPI001AF281AD|nr:DUF4145 domain-containing protein [Nitrosospira sp. NRS527]BCT68302.1 hypothetical protein NNRS527_01898 [Nitrosospira sp. NRS527]